MRFRLGDREGGREEELQFDAGESLEEGAFPRIFFGCGDKSVAFLLTPKTVPFVTLLFDVLPPPRIGEELEEKVEVGVEEVGEMPPPPPTERRRLGLLDTMMAEDPVDLPNVKPPATVLTCVDIGMIGGWGRGGMCWFMRWCLCVVFMNVRVYQRRYGCRDCRPEKAHVSRSDVR